MSSCSTSRSRRSRGSWATIASTCCWRRTSATSGAGNTAWVRRLQGRADAVRRAATAPRWRSPARRLAARSAGFVGVSDGWQDLSRHKRLRLELRAGRERQRGADRRGRPRGLRRRVRAGARLRLRRRPRPGTARAASLRRRLRRARWTSTSPAGGTGSDSLLPLDDASGAGRRQPLPHQHGRAAHPRGQALPRRHRSPACRFPWGFSKGDDDLGGYHLVWPRDLVETAGGLLAAGAHEDARRVLHYLRRHPGSRRPLAAEHVARRHAYWDGVQIDETALPILLVDLARREGALAGRRARRRLWPMVAPRGRLPRAQRPGHRRRTAGRRTAATRRSRSRPRSPRCWPRPSWPS